ncbi:glutathione S-transferase family protein [Pseudomonas sp. C1C7]|uniref:glutathione S-transferase family protein n=1 Tax=Pseudomonas sp. C1C7 TaxID=2735272 RepID=UPI00158621B4|nr:glutathione S-transferase [Pseudomonas sp. C1C7]NUT78310.1 glutathione S-transferase family protein [Pseudomonas sp. C1C7]
MLKLYGFAASNYFNMVKLALLEKGVAFETVPFYGCQNPQILAVSPRGKVPVLETAKGFLSETDAILDFIEETQEGVALLPTDPFERARVRALAKEIELYIELPARVCYVEVFFGGRPTPQALRDKAERDLLKGFKALKQRARFSPFVAGEQFTLADLYFLYSVDLAVDVGKRLFGIDYLMGMPGATALLQRLAENPNVQKVAADREAEAPAFLARVRAVGSPGR